MAWRDEWPSAAARTVVVYEISDELRRRQIQVLERRYGGRLRAHAAATRIQRAFRQSRLLQQWRRIVVPRQSLPLCSAEVHDHTALSGTRATFSSRRLSSSRCQATTPLLTSQLRASQLRQLPSSSGVKNTTKHEIDSVSFRPSVECLSPRLAQTRIAAGGENSVGHVWLPRSSTVIRNSSHTSSLPRLDKHSPAVQISNVTNSFCDSDDQRRRRQYRIALNFFNKKPARGEQLLIEWGFVDNNPEAMAKLLIARRGLSKQMIGEYLGEPDPFHSAVRNHFFGHIKLDALEIDRALRHALTYFRLPGEAQKIDRIMQAFSARYAECNPHKVKQFHSPDTVFILAFAVVMLNTDLHSPSIKASRKMKLEDFINNLRGIDAGHDIDRELLVDIYGRIRVVEFLSGWDHVMQVWKVDQSIVGRDKPKLAEPHRRLVCYCRMNQVVDKWKRQTSNAHQRDVFLFNDLILVAKLTAKKKATCQYSLRSWTSLLGLSIRLFETPYYEHGIIITFPDKQKLLMNLKNENDRQRFVVDVKESVAECTEMEAIRIEGELDKHSLLSKNDVQRDSGLPDAEPNVSDGINGLQKGNQSSCSVRRLSFNSFDSGVVEENGDPHSTLSPITSLFASKRLEAAI